MLASKYILAFDLGTSAAKTALVSITGEVIGWEQEPLSLHLLPGGGAEQVPEDWWQAFLNTTRRLLARQLVPTQAIAAVCATTQGSGTIPIDRDGNALGNCITWLDTRGAPYAQAYIRGTVNFQSFDPIKLLRWIHVTGGAPSLSGNDNLGHILYLQHECPEIYTQAAKFLNVLDYFNFRLTGEIAATPDSITLAWLTDNRDINQIHYDDRLVKDSNIAPNKLPRICQSIEELGTLTPEIATELGLDPHVKVIAGAIDYSAAAVGSGAVEEKQVHFYIGTSSWLAAHVAHKKTDASHGLMSMPCAIPGKYMLLATQDSAGANLTFLRDRIFFDRDALLAVEPEDYFESLNAVASSSPPGSNGVVYTPWLYGERVPFFDATLRAGFYNVSLNNHRADLVRAVFEGVGLNTRWMLGPVEKFLGLTKAGPIRMVGGGARSDLWCQILADILDRPVIQGRDPQWVNVRGAAFIAAVGLGEISFADIPALVPYQNEFAPDPRYRSLYDERYQIFEEIYRKNKDIYARLNRPK